MSVKKKTLMFELADEPELEISEEKNAKLYAAIHGPIMDLRVKIGLAEKSGGKVDVDHELFGMVERIFERVGNTFNYRVV